jgi:DNA-binding transcriptional MerR regulator
MGRRLTVWLDDDLEAWVDDQTPPDGAWESHAALVRAALRHFRAADASPEELKQYAEQPHDELNKRVEQPHDEATDERLNKVERRLAEIEERLGEGSDRGGAEDAESTRTVDAGASPTDGAGVADERGRRAEGLSLTDAERVRVREAVTGRRRELREQRVDEAARVAAYLQRVGTASKNDVVADCWHGEHAGYQQPSGWWAHTIRPGLHALSESRPIDAPAAGGPWRWGEE